MQDLFRTVWPKQKIPVGEHEEISWEVKLVQKKIEGLEYWGIIKDILRREIMLPIQHSRKVVWQQQEGQMQRIRPGEYRSVALLNSQDSEEYRDCVFWNAEGTPRSHL